MQNQNQIVTGFKSSLPFWMILGIIVVFFTPLILLLTFHPFDGLYGQDPYAYYDYATGPLRGSLIQLDPIPSFFWPPGYPLLITISTFLFGLKPFAGQIISLITGALVPIFTALLAKELMSDEKNGFVPALAGVLVALTPQLWQSSVVVMADTTGLAAATMGVWALARYGKQPEGNFKWLALAVIGVAYAVLSRWAYALTAIPCGVYGIWALRQTPRRALFHLIGATILAGFVLSPVILPALTVYFSPSPPQITNGQATFTGDLTVYKWNPINAFRKEFFTGDGLLRYSLPNGVYYAAAPAHRYFFTPILAMFLLPGLWTVFRKRDPAWIVLILGWAGMVYGFHAGAPWQNFRFTLAYLPPLAVLAALGLETVRIWIPQKFRWGLSAVIALGLGGMVYGGWTLTENFILRKNAELETVRQVQNQLPSEARLITFGLTLTFQHYTDLETYEIFVLQPDEIASLSADDQPIYLFLELGSIETQWVNRPPSINYHWLLDGPGLTPINEIEMRGLSTEGEHVYTLFEVQRP